MRVRDYWVLMRSYERCWVNAFHGLTQRSISRHDAGARRIWTQWPKPHNRHTGNVDGLLFMILQTEFISVCYFFSPKYFGHFICFCFLLSFFLFCTTNSLINLLLCSDIRRNLYFTKRKKSKHFGKWCVIKNSADHFVCECGAEHAFLSRSQPVQYMRNDNTVELIKQAYICCCDQRNCLYELLEHKSKRFGCQAAAATEQSEPKCMQKKKKKGT